MNDSIQGGLLVVLVGFCEVEALVKPRGEQLDGVGVGERQGVPVRPAVGDAGNPKGEDVIRLYDWWSE